MKFKKATLILLVFMLPGALLAQTSVSGFVSGTWTAAGSPYYVTDMCTVQTSLTIQPGVDVLFQGDYSIVIQGTLNAIGTESDSILFTLDPGTGAATEFQGIRFGTGAGGTISYARVEGGSANSAAAPTDLRGGAIYCGSASPTLSHLVIKNNSANTLGGGICLVSSSSLVEYCEVYNNSATFAGGIYVSGDATLQYNRVYSNNGSALGGGMNLDNGFSPTVENNLIYSNSAANGGGIVALGGNTASVMNNVIYGNSATTNGGGIDVTDAVTNISMINNAIRNNTAANGGQIFVDTDAAATVDYSNIQGGIGGTGGDGTLTYGDNNITSVPNFANAGAGDFHIEATSTLVDAGTNTGAPPDDFDGNARPFDGDRNSTSTVDIGPYEYRNTVPVITTTEVDEVDEDQAYNYDVDADDPDAGETLTYSLAAGPLFLSINSATGEISGLPDNDDVGSYPVTVVVTDLNGATDTQPFTLTVNQVNDAPVVSDIPNQDIDEGGTFTAIALDNFVDDVDNIDPQITWVATGNVELGVDINPATRVAVVTIPNANWNGQETITFTASDTEPLSDADAAVFTVNSINDAPVVSDIPGQTIDEGATFTTINLDDYVDDVDHTDAQITWDYTGNTELSVDITARVATITAPSADWNGSETITFTASDPDEDSDNDDATFQVNSINDAPVVTDIPNQTIDEGATFTTINLDDYVSDADHGDAEMTWTYGGNSELTVDITARVATITIPNLDWNGSETITFTATDPDNDADNDDATFLVNSINDLPVVTDIPDQTIGEGATFATISLDGYVSDVDHGDAEMTWTYGGNSELTVDITARVATITIPNLDWNGSETVTFTATDPENGAAGDDATFEVTSENDAPVVTDIPDQTIDEGGTFATIALDDYVSDVDHSDAEITWTYSGNTDLTVDITDRVATIGIPNVDWNGSELITFTATDPLDGNNSNGATFEVNSINDIPVVTDIPDQTIDEGATFTTINLDDFVSDADHTDAELTWGYTGNSELTVDITNRVATIGIPNVDWNGNETITFTVTDPEEGTDNDAATFEVASINDAPVVADIPDQNVEEGSSFTAITLDDYVSDVDHADDLMVWTYSGNVELTVDITDRIATITIPDVNWIGMESITFTVTDPDDSTDSDVATFEVNNVNDPPVISDIETQVFDEDGSLIISLTEIMSYVHDPDHPDSLLLLEAFPGRYLTVSMVGDSALEFSAPENWNGMDTIAANVSDGELADSTLIVFQVKPVNDTPFFTEEVPDTVNIFLMADEEMNIADYADDHDFDMPGDSLRWEVSVSDDTLKFDFDPETKDLTLTAPDYAGVFTVTITVTDDSGAVAEESFAVKAMVDPSAIENIEQGIPSSYVLKQNYPNPFNPSTHIKFGLPQAGDVLVEIYNLLGQKIVTLFDGYKSAGYHVVDFEASNLPSGMYFYRIQADKFNSVKKMMLIK